MISRDLELTINNNTASLKEPVTVYMYDRGIKLNVTIKKYKFNTGYLSSENMLVVHPGIYKASTIIKSPDGKIFKHPLVKTEILNDTLEIIITKDWTDEADEIGDYEVQIQLFDDEDSRVSLPPFKITVSKPLFPYDDSQNGNMPGYTDNSEFGSAIIGQDHKITDESKIESGFYDKTLWSTNMIVSKESLNKIETRLDEIYSGEGVKKTLIPHLDTNSKTILGAINELNDLFKLLKTKVETFTGQEIPSPEIPKEEIVPITDIIVNYGVYELSTTDNVVNLNAVLVPNDTTETELVWNCLSSNIADIQYSGTHCSVTRKEPGLAIITCGSKNKPKILKTVYITFNVIDTDYYDILFTSEGTKTLFVNGDDVTNEVVLIQSNVNDNENLYGYKTEASIESLSFRGNSNLTEVLKLSNINLNSTKDMFSRCEKLRAVPNFAVDNVTDMQSMFNQCKTLTSLDVSNWNTGKVINMNGLFYGCSSLTSLDVSNWNTGKVINMAWMFYDCGTLASINTNNWNFSNVNTMISMFQNCVSLENIPYIDISSAYAVNSLFENCFNLSGKIDPNMYWEKESFTTGGPLGIFTNHRCFENCVKLENYNEIPDTWGGNFITPKNCRFDGSETTIVTSESSINVIARVTPFNAVFEDLEFIDKNNFATITVLNKTTSDEFLLVELEVTKNNANGISSISAVSNSNRSFITDVLTIEFNSYNAAEYDIIFTKPYSADGTCLLRINDPYNANNVNTEAVLLDINEKNNVATYGLKTDEHTHSVNFNVTDAETGLCVNSDIIDVLKLPNTITNSSYMFQNCTELRSIPEIDISECIYANSMFDGCSKIESLTLKASIDTKFDDNVFKNCISLSKIICNDLETVSAIANYLPSTNGTIHTEFQLEDLDLIEAISNKGWIADNTAYDIIDNYGVVFNCNGIPSGMIVNGQNLYEDDFAVLDGNYCYGKNFSINEITFPKNVTNILKLDTSSLSKLTFNNCSSLTTLDASNWNTSKINNMSNMFNGCSSLVSLDIANWNTDSVVNMSNMFNGCSSLTILDLSNWSTDNVANASNMFNNCSSLTSLDIANWNVKSLLATNNMFNGCLSMVSLTCNQQNTIEKLAKLLYNRSILDEGTIKTTVHPKNLSLDVLRSKNWRVLHDSIIRNITITSDLKFISEVEPGTVFNLEIVCEPANYDDEIIFEYNTEYLRKTEGSNEFTVIAKLDAGSSAGTYIKCTSKYNYDKASDILNMRLYNPGDWYVEYTVIDDTRRINDENVFAIPDFFDQYGTLINKTNSSRLRTRIYLKDGEITDDTNTIASDIDYIRIWYDENTSQIEFSDSSWYDENYNKISFIKSNKISFIKSIRYLKTDNLNYCNFCDCDKLEYVNSSNWNTSNMTIMGLMFYGCSSLVSLDTSNWDTSNVFDMDRMFRGCSSLTSLDLSNWDVNNVTDTYSMANMFYDCEKLESLDISNWNHIVPIIQGTSIVNMFINCDSIREIKCNNIDCIMDLYDHIPVKSENSPGYIITSCSPENLPFDEFASKYWIFKSTAEGYISDISLSTNLNNLNAVVEGTEFEIYVDTNPSSFVNDEIEIIYDNKYLARDGNNFTVLDNEAFESTTITYKSKYNQFIKDSITIRIVSSYYVEYTVDNADVMLNEARAENFTIGLPKFFYRDNYTVEVTLLDGTIVNHAEVNAKNVNKIKVWYPKDTESIIFENTIVKTIEHIKTDNFNNMTGMFFECHDLTNISNISSWDTSNVTYLNSMFDGCSSLISLDLSGWDTSKVASMSSMFRGCSSLTSLDLSDWDTSNVTSLFSMFDGCSSLTSLDLSSWDTSKVISMDCMFYGCSSLTSLDLSSWDTSKVTNVTGKLFFNCNSLNKVKCDVSFTVQFLVSYLIDRTEYNTAGTFISECTNTVYSKTTLSNKNWELFEMVRTTSLNIQCDTEKISLGDSVKINVIMSSQNANEPYEWYISDNTIATIDNNGYLLPSKTGVITVYAQSIYSNNKSNELTFEIVQNAYAVIDYTKSAVEPSYPNGVVLNINNGAEMKTSSPYGLYLYSYADLSTVEKRASYKITMDRTFYVKVTMDVYSQYSGFYTKAEFGVSTTSTIDYDISLEHTNYTNYEYVTDKLQAGTYNLNFNAHAYDPEGDTSTAYILIKKIEIFYAE